MAETTITPGRIKTYILLRARLRKELLDILARFRVPMIMITHDPEDIKVFAETVVTYEAGRVCEIQHPLKAVKWKEERIIRKWPLRLPNT